MRLLVLCCLCFQTLGVTKAEEKDEIIKNFSLWEMCEELVDNSALQQKLQMTDTQLGKQALGSDPVYCFRPVHCMVN